MDLVLKRRYLKDSYTIGHLYIDGQWFCDTLEDKVRPIGEPKVCGKTAIPYGRYKVTLDVRSPKYTSRASYVWCGAYLPRLLDVPNFDGILIHAGNSAEDSAGCILVGENKVRGRLINSMATLRRLYACLKASKLNNEDIWITIE